MLSPVDNEAVNLSERKLVKLNQSLVASGNKATVTGVTGNQGDIATANLSHAGGGTSTVWIGFLIKEASGGATPNGDAVVGAGSNGTANGGPAFGLIFNQNRYGIDNNTGAAGSTALTTTGPSAATTLLVAKLDFNLGMDIFS